MGQTKESNKRAPGLVVIYISVHLASIYTLTFNVLLVLTLNLIVHKPSYCKCSLAWCQARTFLLFTIWTHPLQMREYPLQYASTDKNKKSHYSNINMSCINTKFSHEFAHKVYLTGIHGKVVHMNKVSTIITVYDCIKEEWVVRKWHTWYWWFDDDKTIRCASEWFILT